MRLGLIALLSACGPDSRYELTILPVVPPNLELDDGASEVSLVHRVAGRATLLPLGPLDAGPFQQLPPLEAGAVGLLLGRAGSASGAWDRDHLIAWGESPLDAPLHDDGERVSLPILLAGFGGVGELGGLPRRSAPLLGAVAMTPGGSVTTFGGQHNGAPHAVIHHLPDVRARPWTFREAGAMPAGDDLPGRVLHTATPLDDGTILVTGGRSTYFAIGDNQRDAFIWDPATQSVLWQEREAMNPGRSQHVAVLLRSGRVLVVGGWTGAGATGSDASYQLFDPIERRFLAGGTTPAQALGVAVTSVGGDGAVVCGGFAFDRAAEALTPTARCARISLGGDVIPFPDLPVAVGLGALAATPDGRLVYAGGVHGVIPVPFDADGFLVGDNVGTASDRVFAFAPGEGWREIEPLREARAGASAIASGDGRVLVIGGSRIAGPMISEDAEPAFCVEIVDPVDGSARAGSPCSTPGSGAFPLVSAQPGIGAFVVEGHVTIGGDERGGQAYGIVGVAPTL